MKHRKASTGIGLVALLLASGGAPAQQQSLTDQYRDAAAKVIGGALEDTAGWEKLSHLTTRIGNRLSGSPQLERAVAWAAETMRAEGLEGVTLQPVNVPHWVRGRESLVLLSPFEKPMALLGLGGSIGTPPAGISASVVVVRSFTELGELGGDKIAGKIVLYDVPFTNYGQTVQYRGNGAARAAQLGAVGMLLRSVTPRSLYTPHTGVMNLESGPPPIPAAAITIEDAELIHRLLDMGQDVRVRLIMEAHTLPDADSANVVGELRGSEKTEEVVVIGGHLDSWDVGQGAHDDGAGVMAAWEAVTLLKRLGLRPRRTIRVVLFTNEENGARGAQAYHDAVGAAVKKHVAAIEMDGGAEKPVGFGFTLPGVEAKVEEPRYVATMAALKQIGRLLEGIDGGQITFGGGGTDIGPTVREGVPALGLRTVGEHYFDWHHSNADTLDKVDPQNFRRCIAHLAVMAYVLADMPMTLAEIGDAAAKKP